jgi:transcriptional regulator with XRE-family HTH domain
MSRLKQKIKSCGMTQDEVCKQAGVDRKTVNRQCRDGIQTARVARRYAEVLKCHPQELLEY